MLLRIVYTSTCGFKNQLSLKRYFCDDYVLENRSFSASAVSLRNCSCITKFAKIAKSSKTYTFASGKETCPYVKLLFAGVTVEFSSHQGSLKCITT